ncbi:hypothetical protein [Empedobacter brevis]|uniref:hypothetical protein n=1 Tax=Empedobacter brevis TaxID=247 RepID=UPI0039AFAEC7
MEQIEFKAGDIVSLKASSDQEFVVSNVTSISLEVVWFNNQLKEFKSATLAKEVFYKVR